VSVHLVRHACAGDKTRWAGPDLDRPLDEAGVLQAEALADLFESVPVERIVTSPARRCRQTVEPLARRHGVPIEPLAGLLPDGDPEYVRGLIAVLDAEVAGAGAAVVCVHGETMRPLLTTVRQTRGKVVAMRDDDDWLLRKGTGWELTLDGNGTIVALRHRAPHPLATCPSHDPLVS
jgi:phosphohistidine phosphatase SixA